MHQEEDESGRPHRHEVAKCHYYILCAEDERAAEMLRPKALSKNFQRHKKLAAPRLVYDIIVSISSLPMTPRRRRIITSTIMLISSLSSSPSFRCDAFMGVIIISNGSNRRGIIARRRRRRSSTPTVESTNNNGIYGVVSNGEEGVEAVDAALFGIVVDENVSDASSRTSTSTLNTVVQEARALSALENELLGPDGAPHAPMMTYQKYLTMQVSIIFCFDDRKYSFYYYCCYTDEQLCNPHKK